MQIQAQLATQTIVDVESSMEEYLERRDWRVNANANQGYSLGGLILNVAGKVTANYWLSHVYSPEAGRAHREGDLHIHDLDMLSGYCAGWSLRQLLFEGFNGVPGKVEAKPARHMSAAVGQIVNFLGTIACALVAAGAVISLVSRWTVETFTGVDLVAIPVEETLTSRYAIIYPDGQGPMMLAHAFSEELRGLFIINGGQRYSLNLFLRRNTFNGANTDVPHRFYPRSLRFSRSTRGPQVGDSRLG